MPNFTVLPLAPTGSTGNNTHNGVKTPDDSGAIALQFVVEVLGATPTITFKYQGSMGGTLWYDLIYFTDANDTLAVATRVTTALATTTPMIQFLDRGIGTSRDYAYIRCVTTSNTNVTYRAEMWAASVDAD